MPSHFGNWMKQERKTIKNRMKSMEQYLKLGSKSQTVGYELVKGNDMECRADVFRKQYQPLSEDQKVYMEAFKDKAEELIKEFEASENTPFLDVNKRCMALAKTNLEQAVMWAVKAITK
jgi:hypothetical protein